MKIATGLFTNDKKSCYLLTDRYYRRYFCGVDIAEGYVLVTDGGVTCFTDARYFYQVKPKLESVGVKAMLFNGLESIKKFITDNGITTVCIDFDTSTVREYEEYKTLANQVKDGALALKKLRAIKTEQELGYIKKACSITQKAFYELLGELKEGVTELEIKEKLIKLYLKHGADGEGFDTIVAFGENSAVPHHQTGDTALKKGMPVLIDTGCVVNGYISDYTRTLYFGTPSQKFLRCYDAVESANRLAIENITDGTTCKQADGYARDYLKGQGLAEYFTHSLGHGLGLEVHEYPTLSYRRDDELKNGMVFTVEPGVYFDGEFGIRIEDSVALMDGKAQRLYDDEKKLIIL